MVNCPECGSYQTTYESSGKNYRMSDQFNIVAETEYTCQNCGCEFTVTEKTTTTTEVTKHGDEHEE